MERRGDDDRLGCLSAEVVAMALAAGRKRSMMKLGERRDPATPSMALSRAESAARRSEDEVLSSASEKVSSSSSSSLSASVVLLW
uniref:Uncharacterized protein n=1 Tax=Arundo donax TaxID=35708 RepID=A0A0A9HCQ4_ARUDO